MKLLKYLLLFVNGIIFLNNITFLVRFFEGKMVTEGYQMFAYMSMYILFSLIVMIVLLIQKEYRRSKIILAMALLYSFVFLIGGPVLIAIVAISTTIYLLTSWDSTYGKEYNDKRIKRKIPVIPDNWFLNKNDCTKEFSEWLNPIVKEGKNKQQCHLKKAVYHKNGSLYHETDTYLGIKEIQNNEMEKIAITYTYKIDKDNNPENGIGFASILWNKDNKDGIKISIGEAESILKSWNVERIEHYYR